MSRSAPRPRLPKPAIARSRLPKPGLGAWRRTAFYELKAVPVKNRVYRYWYLRYSDGGVLRSLYLGKQAPERLTPREAVDALHLGADPLELEANPRRLDRFRESRSRRYKLAARRAAR